MTLLVGERLLFFKVAADVGTSYGRAFTCKLLWEDVDAAISTCVVTGGIEKRLCACAGSDINTNASIGKNPIVTNVVYGW